MTKVSLEGSYLPSLPIDVFSAVPEKGGIEDLTETNLVNLRRVTYLTIINASTTTKLSTLLKFQLKEGEEVLF